MAAPQQGSGMTVMIIAFLLVCVAIGGSYWYFVVNKPKATASVTPTATSAEFTITGYTKPMYVMLKSGTVITHAAYVPSGKYTPSALSPGTSYKYYILTEDMDVLLASGTFTTADRASTSPSGPGPSTAPGTPGPSPVPATVTAPVTVTAPGPV